MQMTNYEMFTEIMEKIDSRACEYTPKNFSGISVLKDDASITLGKGKDVVLQRASKGVLKIIGNLTVTGDLRSSATDAHSLRITALKTTTETNKATQVLITPPSAP